MVHWCLQAARQNNDSRAHRFIGQIGCFSSASSADVVLIRHDDLQDAQMPKTNEENDCISV